MTDLTEADIRAALERCAAEPVRIPGHVQPFGCLLACDPGSRAITHVSHTAQQHLGSPPDSLLGQNLKTLLGRELWHDVNGALSTRTDPQPASPIGILNRDGRAFYVSAFQSSGRICVELEPTQPHTGQSSDALRIVTYLSDQIAPCTSQDSLTQVSVDTLRQITGYERVIAYKFDAEWNGEVVAEARAPYLDPLLGLRFPHWDIPPQARAIMAELPLRMIADVTQPPAPLSATHGEAPLDLTPAACRGVSPVHMQYLRNMGVGASMTVSVMQGEKLWGTLAFHHSRPRLPPPYLRDVMVHFATIFSLKLQNLAQQERLAMVTRIEGLQGELLSKVAGDLTLDAAFGPIAEVICDTLNADGVALVEADGTVTGHGALPGLAALIPLAARALERSGAAPLKSENLAEAFADLATEFGAVAGVLAQPIGGRRSVLVFRNAIAQSVRWAGNPKKTVETVDGNARLEPRGSFSLFLEEVKGRCAPWSDADLVFAEQIWSIVSAAEREVFSNRLDRQQKLMIQELNHRGRNLMGLVQSIAHQARRHHGTLDAFYVALEARIDALARAHDLTPVADGQSVGLHHLIAHELEPFGRADRMALAGPDPSVRAEHAPILSLALHELVTNAGKYGALSTAQGQVLIDVSEVDRGYCIGWRERGGPAVSPPAERGFGTVLIGQAVPHELGGQVDLTFGRDGVEARIWLPQTLFVQPPDSSGTASPPAPLPSPPADERPTHASLSQIEGVFLILDNSFVIAEDLRAQFHDLGARSVEVFSNALDAMEFLEHTRPVFACLDVNLGADETSISLARTLAARDIPFVFITGYGDSATLPEELKSVPRLIKPLRVSDLQQALAQFFPGPVVDP